MFLTIGLSNSTNAKSNAVDMSFGIANSALNLAFLPVTATISCLNHKLEICRPQAAYIVLTCETNGILIAESFLTAIYLDEERNEEVLDRLVIWHKTQQLNEHYGHDLSESTIAKNIILNNNITNQQDLECRQQLANLTKEQASGYPIR